MSLRSQSPLRVILYEGEGTQPLEVTDRFAVLTALLEGGYGVARATQEQTVRQSTRGPVLILGRFGESSPQTFQAAPGRPPVRTLNLAGLAPAQLGEAIQTVRDEVQAPTHGQWKPWFPVIDYDRCTNCMQCLSFCLFGVYGVDGEKRLQVQNQDNCKTNCPACSRVCPEAAIMFPKYKAGPINGDEVSDADLQKEKMKVDISALLGGDVYAMLRLRSEKAKSRFSKERDSDKALSERQKCLTKLAQMGDIPPEVLMSLPSPEEIARRAEEAAEKARAALA